MIAAPMKSKPPSLPPHWCMPKQDATGRTFWYHITRKDAPHGGIGPGGPTIKEARQAAKEFLAAQPPPPLHYLIIDEIVSLPPTTTPAP